MSFPQTRLTLIQRLAAGGAEGDWEAFLNDYWGPVCRFALRFGAGNRDEAEDVASQTFEVLWENRLLVRWVAHRSAKLRTLLCGVVRRILANRGRVRANRQRLSQDMAQWLRSPAQAPDDQGDVFYAAWVEDVVHQAVEALAADYYRSRKGDYVRVLYGRLCRSMTIAEVAEALNRKPSDVDNYYRHARARLAERLEAVSARTDPPLLPRGRGRRRIPGRVGATGRVPGRSRRPGRGRPPCLRTPGPRSGPPTAGIRARPGRHPADQDHPAADVRPKQDAE